MADETRQYRKKQPLSRDTSEVAGAVLGGMFDSAVSTPALVAQGANYLYGKTPLTTPEDTARRSESIQEFTDNPPFLPDELNSYRQYLKENYPGTSFASGLVSPGGIAKQGLSRMSPVFGSQLKGKITREAGEKVSNAKRHARDRQARTEYRVRKDARNAIKQRTHRVEQRAHLLRSAEITYGKNNSPENWAALQKARKSYQGARKRLLQKRPGPTKAYAEEAHKVRQKQAQSTASAEIANGLRGTAFDYLRTNRAENLIEGDINLAEAAMFQAPVDGRYWSPENVQKRQANDLERASTPRPLSRDSIGSF